MRSRYAAYALGNLGYIEATSGGPAALGFDRREAEMAQLGTKWLGLEIVATRKGRKTDTEGTVSFVARYRQGGQEGALRETSEFRKLNGSWLYWDRKIVPATALSSAAPVGRMPRS